MAVLHGQSPDTDQKSARTPSLGRLSIDEKGGDATIVISTNFETVSGRIYKGHSRLRRLILVEINYKNAKAQHYHQTWFSRIQFVRCQLSSGEAN